MAMKKKLSDRTSPASRTRRWKDTRRTGCTAGLRAYTDGVQVDERGDLGDHQQHHGGDVVDQILPDDEPAAQVEPREHDGYFQFGS
jgi:hypothetical protein